MSCLLKDRENYHLLLSANDFNGNDKTAKKAIESRRNQDVLKFLMENVYRHIDICCSQSCYYSSYHKTIFVSIY